MTLQRLIEELSKFLLLHGRLRIASPEILIPLDLESYRGYYEDLAITYTSEALLSPQRGETLVKEFIELAQSSIGKNFMGYKGGVYRASQDTRVWVSNYGEASGAQVSEVYADDDVTYIGVRMSW